MTAVAQAITVYESKRYGRETAGQRVNRLCDQGEAKGIELTPPDNWREVPRRAQNWTATSSRDAARLYVVSAEGGCSCEGYRKTDMCMHWALLLEHLGLLPEPEDAEAIVAAAEAIVAARAAELERPVSAERVREILAEPAAEPVDVAELLAELVALEETCAALEREVAELRAQLRAGAQANA